MAVCGSLRMITGRWKQTKKRRCFLGGVVGIGWCLGVMTMEEGVDRAGSSSVGLGAMGVTSFRLLKLTWPIWGVGSSASWVVMVLVVVLVPFCLALF